MDIEIMLLGLALIGLLLALLGASYQDQGQEVEVDWTVPTKADRKTRKMLDS
jgi:hypothetical protein